MRFLSVLLLAAPLAAATWTPDRILRVKRVSDVQVSPDARRVLFVAGDQIWTAGTDGSGAAPLTRGRHPRWSPDTRWIAFLKDESGRTNIWRIRPGGGAPEALTNFQSAISGFKWSPGGRWIAFGAPAQAGSQPEWRIIGSAFKQVRLWVIAAEPNSLPRALTDEQLSLSGAFGGGWLDWSPDEKRIVFAHMPQQRFDDWRKTDISEVEVESGRTRTVAATAAAEDSPLYSPDGRWIAYRVSDIPPHWGIDFRVWVASTAGKPVHALAETFNREPALIGWTADSSAVIVEETLHTSHALYRLPLAGAPTTVYAPGQGSFRGVSLNQSHTTLGLAIEQSAAAPEAFISSLDRVAPRQVSHVNAELPKVTETGVIRWEGPGGLSIEGLLTLPFGYQDGKRCPLLVITHGGPPMAFTQTFIGSSSTYPIAAFAERGYAVLRPNIRGSTGYGRDFRYANYGDWGGKDFADMMAGVDYLIQKGIADPERLGVMGWSYGGFMTAWTITQTKRFKAASIGAPITDLASLNGTADMATFVPDYFGGEAWEKPEVYMRRSPLFQVAAVSTPVLLQHGADDTVCPLSQSQEFYDALVKRGVTARMVVYPSSGHGIREPKFIRHIMEENLEWFERYLLGVVSEPRP